ncbi:MAG: Ig-like domain-containing protein [Candidatus Paceibacterota bacterium]
MNKIKSNMHKGNKHFVLGLSFFVFALISSVVWGLIYAEGDITSLDRLSTSTSLSTTIPTTSTTSITSPISSTSPTTSTLIPTTNTELPTTTITTVTTTTPIINTTTTQLQSTTTSGSDEGSGGGNTSRLYIPSTPSDLRLDNIVIPYNISLSWNDNSNNEDKFNIEKKLSSASVWSSLAQVGTNVLHYIDTKVIPNTPYDYRISACLSGTPCSGVVKLEKVYTTTITTNPTTPIEPVKPIVPIITTPTETIKPVIPIATIPTETIIPKTPTTTIPKIQIDTLPKVIIPTATIQTTTLPTVENISGVNVASTTTEIKTPIPLETPKEMIESVTAALNILPATLPEIKTDITQTKQVKEQIKQEETARKEVVQQEITKLVYQDTNKDGISDYDSKYVYNMDPVKPSPTSTYEGKSINAGEKILLGFDPGKKELEKVVVEEPATSKSEVVVSLYKVREVALTEKKEVKLKGQALPNSFITLYIYSTPIMVTVKTDSNGEWQYTLDKELENGNHTVYTATVNNTGNIVAKSTPFTFVKTAEAVTLQDLTPIQSSTSTTMVERPVFVQTKNIFFLGIVLLMIIGVILVLIGLFSKKVDQA